MGSTLTSVAVWAARIVLAAVFGFAAVAKLRDAESSIRGAKELDVPDRLLPLAARVLPLVEAAVAIGLVVPPVSAVAAGVGLALLLVFTAAVLRVLSTGRVPMCFCFGSTNSQPANRDAVIRNIALAALCLVVVVSP